MAQTTIQGSYLGANTVDGTKLALTSQATGDIMYYNGTDWIRSANLNYSGTVLDVKSATNGTAPGIKLYCDNNNAHYILIKGGAHGDSTSYTLTLPPAAPTSNGQALTATTVGVASWAQAGHTVAGTTANGILTYTDSTNFASEANLTFNGSTNVLALIGTMTISSTLTATSFLQGASLRTPLIEYTDGDDAITIADGGGITVAQNAIFAGTITTPSVLFKGTSNAITMDVNNGVNTYTIKLPDAAPGSGTFLKATSGDITQLEWGTVTSSDTTYTHTWQDASDNAVLRLTAGGSGSGNDDLTIVAGTNITLTPSGDNLTIAAAAQTFWKALL